MNQGLKKKKKLGNIKKRLKFTCNDAIQRPQLHILCYVTGMSSGND